MTTPVSPHALTPSIEYGHPSNPSTSAQADVAEECECYGAVKDCVVHIVEGVPPAEQVHSSGVGYLT